MRAALVRPARHMCERACRLLHCGPALARRIKPAHLAAGWSAAAAAPPAQPLRCPVLATRRAGTACMHARERYTSLQRHLLLPLWLPPSRHLDEPQLQVVCPHDVALADLPADCPRRLNAGAGAAAVVAVIAAGLEYVLQRCLLLPVIARAVGVRRLLLRLRRRRRRCCTARAAAGCSWQRPPAEAAAATAG